MVRVIESGLFVLHQESLKPIINTPSSSRGAET